MDNLTLRVATFQVNGFTKFQEVKNKLYFLNEGAMSKLFLLMQEKLNFKYEIIIEKTLGSKSSNGSWNGRIGYLARKEADIAFPVGINYQIHEDIETTPPTHLVGVNFLTASPEEISKILALFRTLNYEVWIAMLFTTLITTVAFYKIFSSEAKLYNKKIPQLLNIFWTLLGTFMNQGSDLLQSRRLCIRVIIIGWTLPISILVASYGASFMSFVAFPGYKRIPETFEELIENIEQGRYTASTMKDSAIDSFILSSTHGLSLRLKNQMQQKRIVTLNVDNIKEYERILKEKHAVIYFESSLIVNADKKGMENFRLSKDSLFFSIQVWGMRQFFLHKEKINQIVLYCLQSGIFDKFIADEIHKVRRRREMEENIKDDKNRSLNLYDTAGAFIILIFGYMLSCLALITEKIVFNNNNKKNLHKI